MKSGKFKIEDAEGFAKCADEIIEGVKSLYMLEAEIMNQSKDVKETS